MFLGTILRTIKLEVVQFIEDKKETNTNLLT